MNVSESTGDAARRAELINRAAGVKTVEDIEALRRDLADWLGAHADDGLRDLDDHLVRTAEEMRAQIAPSVVYMTEKQDGVGGASGPPG